MLMEECFGIVVCLGLYILRQRQRDRACLSRTCQDAHGLWQRCEQLFRSGDAVPVTTNRLEAFIDRDILAMFGLKLL